MRTFQTPCSEHGDPKPKIRRTPRRWTDASKAALEGSLAPVNGSRLRIDEIGVT